MINIGDKEATDRQAVVSGKIYLNAETLKKINNNQVPKGNVLVSAKLAAMMAAKKTADLLPYCHPIPIEHVEIDLKMEEDGITVTALVRSHTKTGVEMEAFVAVSGACLTIYDMSKWMGQDMIISNVCLAHKSGGKSGDFNR